MLTACNILGTRLHSHTVLPTCKYYIQTKFMKIFTSLKINFYSERKILIYNILQQSKSYWPIFVDKLSTCSKNRYDFSTLIGVCTLYIFMNKVVKMHDLGQSLILQHYLWELSPFTFVIDSIWLQNELLKILTKGLL